MKYNKVAIFLHANEFDRPDADCTGHITAYLQKHGIKNIDYFLATRDELPKDTDGYDVIFLMGGPGSVVCPDRPEWIDHEIKLIKKRIEKKQKTVGICLGAQMLAIADGGQVSTNKYMEFGFHTVNFHHDTEHPVLSNIPKSEIFMHWHHDGFSPPPSATNIASNSASLHEEYDHWCGGSQAFVNDHYLGLQFHPEMSLETLQFAEALMDDTTARYNQDKSLVLELAPLYLTNPNDMHENCARSILFKLLDNFLEL